MTVPRVLSMKRERIRSVPLPVAGTACIMRRRMETRVVSSRGLMGGKEKVDIDVTGKDVCPASARLPLTQVPTANEDVRAVTPVERAIVKHALVFKSTD